jgi:hypothetical protein
MATKAEMLALVIQAARQAGVAMGIGGGIAVHAHGYRRETADVDAFFHDGDQQSVIRALRQLAPDYTIERLDRSQWIAVPPHAGPDERIDLLFALGDPEESAIEMAAIQSYQGLDAPIFPIDLLIVSKYLAERRDPKDALDILALYQRGAYDVEQVQHRLQQMGLAKEAKAFPLFLKQLAQLGGRPRPRPTGGYRRRIKP